MKKFLASLIILLILVGAAFTWGWITLFIPEGSYGVQFTKTTGYDDTVYHSGEFAWSWERLIPTNAKLMIFPGEPYDTLVTYSAKLPSASVYASIFDNPPTFETSIEIELTLRFNPEKLPELVENYGLDPDGLKSWYEDIADRCMQKTITHLESSFTEENIDSFLTTSSERLERSIHDYLTKEIPEVEIIRAYPAEIHLPDRQLYRQARQRYFEYLKAKSESLARATEEQAKQQVQELSRIDQLKEYGKLLTEYPILLEFLTLEKTGQLPETDLSEVIKKQESSQGSSVSNGREDQ